MKKLGYRRISDRSGCPFFMPMLAAGYITRRIGCMHL